MEDKAVSMPRVIGNAPLATLSWWDLQSSYNEQVCWHCKRQELHGIVSYTEMMKLEAKNSVLLKWLKFCSWLKVKWLDSRSVPYL